MARTGELLVLVLFTGLLVFIGYLYDAVPLYRVEPQRPVPLVAAVLVVGLGLGCLAARPGSAPPSRPAAWPAASRPARPSRAGAERTRQLSRAQEIAQLGSWELDLATDSLSWSDEVYRIFGMAPQEFPADLRHFLEATHPDDRAAVHAAYFGSIREGRDSYEIEHRVVLDRLTRLFEYSRRHPERSFAVLLLDGIPNVREALLVAERVQESLVADRRGRPRGRGARASASC